MLTAVILAFGLASGTPDIAPSTALLHAQLARAYATPDLSPDLLLAVAYVESRYEPTAESHPHGDRPPYYCGIFQTTARSHADCRRQRTLSVAYRLGVGELTWWMRFARGDVRRALSGHACGMRGYRSGRCNHYAERVLSLRRRLK